MENDVQLISDGDGLAVIGEAGDVERFLTSEGLPSQDLGRSRFAGLAALFAQVGSGIAANSARWVKLTEESAKLVDKYGLRESAKTGLTTGVVKGNKGQIRGFVQFARTPKTFLTNPANLANAAKIMSQVAMQQSMEEISAYLATIDEKVDDVLRAQKDTALARMIGVGYVLEEAMTLREVKDRVDEVTWSKVQGAPATVAETQAYALRQLDAIAEKLEKKRSDVGDLAVAARKAKPEVGEWLAVLARCFQLQDAIAVLELDRVLETAPDDLDGHRLGLKAARRDRLEHIARTTERLMARMDAAAGTANAKVLMNPSSSPAVVRSRNEVVMGVHEFQSRLGIGSGRQTAEARRWVEAVADVRDKALETGAKGVDAAVSFGSGTVDVAKSVGSGTVDVAKSVGSGTVDVAKSVGSGTVEAAKSVGSVTGKVAGGIAGQARRLGRGRKG